MIKNIINFLKKQIKKAILKMIKNLKKDSGKFYLKNRSIILSSYFSFNEKIPCENIYFACVQKTGSQWIKQVFNTDLEKMGRHNFELSKQLRWDKIAKKTCGGLLLVFKKEKIKKLFK